MLPLIKCSRTDTEVIEMRTRMKASEMSDVERITI